MILISVAGGLQMKQKAGDYALEALIEYFAKGWLMNAFTILEHVRPPFFIGNFLVYSFRLLAGEVFKNMKRS